MLARQEELALIARVLCIMASMVGRWWVVQDQQTKHLRNSRLRFSLKFHFSQEPPEFWDFPRAYKL